MAEGARAESGAGSGTGSTESDFDQAVRRTEGVQPGRRVFHAASGLLIAWLLASGLVARPVMIALLSGALLVALALDLLRLRSPSINARFFRVLRLLASPRERDQIASSTWYLVGVLATVLLAPTAYAVSAILVLALADPAASVVGRLWGRRRIGSGTVLGTSVFFLIALVLLGFRHPLPLAVCTAALVSVAEILKIRLDDNLRVPIAAALALMGFGAWLG